MPNHLLTKYKASELHYIMKAPLNFGCTLMIFFQVMRGMRSTHMMSATRTRELISDRSSSRCSVYSSLSHDAQRYVDSVATMGFDVSDVACTVSKLGIDDKLV